MTGNSDKEILKELAALGKHHPLRGKDLERAVVLMVALKQRNYTNKQISYATRGTWSEPTVKLYTRRTGRKRTSRRKAVSDMLRALISGRIPLEDLLYLDELRKKLAVQAASLDDVLFVLNEARKYEMSIANALTSYHNLSISGLTANEISRILSIDRELKDNAISPNEFEEILRFCTIHGKSKILAHLRSLK